MLVEGVYLNYQKNILLPCTMCFQERNRTSLGFVSNLSIWPSHLSFLKVFLICKWGWWSFYCIHVFKKIFFLIMVFQTRSKFLRNASRILQHCTVIWPNLFLNILFLKTSIQTSRNQMGHTKYSMLESIWIKIFLK